MTINTLIKGFAFVYVCIVYDFLYAILEKPDWDEWGPWSNCSHHCFQHDHPQPHRKRTTINRNNPTGTRLIEDSICENITVCPISKLLASNLILRINTYYITSNHTENVSNFPNSIGFLCFRMPKC